MKRSIMFGVLFSTALAVGAGAQSTGGQTPSQSGSSDQVTVTGCLQSGGAAGATGTSGAGSTGAGSTGAGFYRRCRFICEWVSRRRLRSDEREGG